MLEMKTVKKKKCYLSSFGLILDVFCGANLGLDILEIRKWLVDDAELLGCGCRGFGWGVKNSYFPLLANQT